MRQKGYYETTDRRRQVDRHHALHAQGAAASTTQRPRRELSITDYRLSLRCDGRTPVPPGYAGISLRDLHFFPKISPLKRTSKGASHRLSLALLVLRVECPSSYTPEPERCTEVSRTIWELMSLQGNTDRVLVIRNKILLIQR